MSYIVLVIVISAFFLVVGCSVYPGIKDIADTEAEERHCNTEERLKRENMALRSVLENRHTVIEFTVKGGRADEYRNEHEANS